jgi:hypothetical protein
MTCRSRHRPTSGRSLVSCDVETVADLDPAGGQDAGGDAAVAADRVVAARTENFLHARTGMAFAGGQQMGGSEAEAAILQGVQIDAAHHDVAAKQIGRDVGVAEIGGDGLEVLCLNHGDLAGLAMAVVADQAGSRIEVRVRDGQHRLPPFRTQADPDDQAGTHRCGEQAGEGGFGVQQETWPPSLVSIGWLPAAGDLPYREKYRPEKGNVA